MMIALRWLYAQGAGADPAAWCPDDGGAAWCWHCGLACPAGAPSRPTRAAIPDTYTEYDVVRCAASPWVCPACAAYFTGVKEFVSYPQVVTPTARRRWERQAMRPELDGLLTTRADLAEPLVLVVVSSPMKRRHVLPRAPVTTGGGRVAVQFDADTIWLTPGDWAAVAGPYDALRALGHGRTEILTGALHPVALARDHAAGRLAEALAASAALAPWRGSAQLALVAYVTVRREGKDQEGKDQEGKEGAGAA